MSRTIGIIGLPNVGKSTIFNCLTGGNAQSSNYPFCTIGPNIGIVEVPDRRLSELKSILRAEEVTPATIKVMDLAGLIKGASQGEGLGNRFLAHAREADVLLHVVRCFEDSDIVNVQGDLDPERDIDIVNIELSLADLEIIENRLEKVSKLARSGDRNASIEMHTLQNIMEDIKRGREIKGEALTLPLLTLKPVIYVANLGEGEYGRKIEFVNRIKRKTLRRDNTVIKIYGRLEEELRGLPEEEACTFRKEWTGEDESPLDKLVQVCYRALNYITFYTIFRGKLSAWSVREGESIVHGAGKIHSDMERGFIKSEVINFKEFVRIGSYTEAKERGLVRIVGRDYLLQDGDIIYIHFSKR